MNGIQYPNNHPLVLGRTSETKQKTLEEIAAAFGDKVVSLTESDIEVENAVMSDKVKAVQVEEGSPAAAKV